MFIPKWRRTRFSKLNLGSFYFGTIPFSRKQHLITSSSPKTTRTTWSEVITTSACCTLHFPSWPMWRWRSTAKPFPRPALGVSQVARSTSKKVTWFLWLHSWPWDSPTLFGRGLIKPMLTWHPDFPEKKCPWISGLLGATCDREPKTRLHIDLEKRWSKS